MLFQEMLDVGLARLRMEVDALGIGPEERRMLIELNHARVTDGALAIFHEVGGHGPQPVRLLEELVNEDELREQLADIRLTFARTDQLPDPPPLYSPHRGLVGWTSGHSDGVRGIAAGLPIA